MPTLTAPDVLVFDSGVGSLCIGADIRRRLPGVSLHYALDTGGFPYGSWPPEELASHVVNRMEQLLQRMDPDIIVVACNSASTVVLPALRERIDIPVVGVVPAIKPAAAITETGTIGVLATPGTAERAYTRQLVSDFAAGHKVLLAGDPDLADAVEYHYQQGTDPQAACEAAIARLQQPGYESMDTVVLACTHFPLIRDRLAALAPDIRHWVDSGEAIARRVQSQLNGIGADSAPVTHRAYLLGKIAGPALPQRLERLGVSTVDLIE